MLEFDAPLVWDEVDRWREVLDLVSELGPAAALDLLDGDAQPFEAPAPMRRGVRKAKRAAPDHVAHAES